ncbi:unnamed protein product [Moneuplotes crassus]|uniref:Uncharacterized protein n=1 Tax=Euplotes crassus TaxID=5936 RepID=A0AAD1Y7F9_EUPCR|nr:unnamed protein product [Moneuplotes crassus]
MVLIDQLVSAPLNDNLVLIIDILISLHLLAFFIYILLLSKSIMYPNNHIYDNIAKLQTDSKKNR